MRALISVSDKEGVVEFAKGLERLGFEILSTGGTHKLLKEQGVKAVEVSEYTGSPEMFEGRVKTLHPKIHGGILHKQIKYAGIPVHVSARMNEGRIDLDFRF